MTAQASAVRSLVAALALVLVAGGCQPDLNTVYGQRGGLGQSSVNGTAVLGEMFEEYGHDVSSRTWLSPSIQRRADCIVWFPNDFQPPQQEVINWLANWLYESPDRTLIYVGRDFDAAPLYWERILPLVPEADRPRVESELAAAKLNHQAQRAALPDGELSEWFTVNAQAKPRVVRDVEGEPEWTEGWDPQRAEIEIAARLEPTPFFGTELASQGDAIVSRTVYDNGSQIILINNGSFLLNLPLVNPEHRRLAGKLIERIGPARSVVFLESGPGGPPLREQENETPPGLLNLFTVAPFDVIFLHLAVIGGVAALCGWPIFGRPRSGGASRMGDFGRHITALGSLLQRTGDREFAAGAVERFRQQQHERRRQPRRGR